MTKAEYDAIQQELSELLEKKDMSGRKIRRSQDYKNAVFAAKSVLHSHYMCYKEDGDSH